MRRGGFPFWRFSMRVYRAPGIAEACLALQDDCGADVNLLLYCCWMGLSGRRLSGPALRSALRAVAHWHREAVQPLRRARRALKKGERHVERGHEERLRKRIGAAEIDAEYLEQRVLAGCAADLPPLAFKGEPRTAATANLQRYLESLAPGAGRREARRLEILVGRAIAVHL